MSKTILITGATDGIGKATAELLATAGHKIIVHARTLEKGKKTVTEIQQKTGKTKVKYAIADFRKLSDIKKMVAQIFIEFKNIDVLINNAGVYRTQKNVLPNGLEETFMVNHLAHFYLTTQLLPLLKEAAHARIINVSSMIHSSSIDFNNLQGEKFYSGSDAYSKSKLCNLLFTNQLAKNLNTTDITVNALHPGVVQTKLLQAGWGAMGENPANSAKRIFYLAENKELKKVTGKYFMNNRQNVPAPIAVQNSTMEKLWEISSELIAKQGF